jgi:sugar phosphate isomerase/epimerase
MYTLRDCYTTPEEFSSLLAKVRDLGFAGIELAGSGGLSAADLKAKLDELGLTIVCSHESLERLDKHLPEVLAWHQAVGCPRIALAWSPAASLDDLAELERVLRKAEPAARAAGIELLYHNHDHEFTDIAGEPAIERISRLVRLEVDTYWVFAAGQDVPAWLRAHAPAIALLHIKDGDRNRHPSALGEGQNDISGILATAQTLGMDWLILENDYPDPDGIQDVSRSVRYLRRLGWPDRMS